MTCSQCGKETYVITITKDYECLSPPSKVHEIDGDKCKKIIDKMYSKIKS